jgi:hypothetical protein
MRRKFTKLPVGYTTTKQTIPSKQSPITSVRTPNPGTVKQRSKIKQERPIGLAQPSSSRRFSCTSDPLIMLNSENDVVYYNWMDGRALA